MKCTLRIRLLYGTSTFSKAGNMETPISIRKYRVISYFHRHKGPVEARCTDSMEEALYYPFSLDDDVLKCSPSCNDDIR